MVGKGMVNPTKDIKVYDCCLPQGLVQTHLPQTASLWKKYRAKYKGTFK